MKMENRRPRATRFQSDDAEARLARLRDQAPTLGSNRRLRLYAIFGAALMLLTVAAFYMAMQVYKAANAYREPEAILEVDIAPEIVEKEVQKAAKRIEEEEAAAQSDYERRLEELKAIDLLEDDGG